MTLLHLDSCAIPPKYTYNVEHVTFVSQNTAQSRTGPYTIRSYTGYDFRYYTTISEGVIGLAVYLVSLFNEDAFKSSKRIKAGYYLSS